MSLCPFPNPCINQIEGGDCDLQCELPPCTETVYSTSASSQRVVPQPNETADEVSLEDYIEININYDAMRQTLVTESRAQTSASLLGNIGGQMGLFMGISFLSLIEVFGELVSLRLLPRWLLGETRILGIGSLDD